MAAAEANNAAVAETVAEARRVAAAAAVEMQLAARVVDAAAQQSEGAPMRAGGLASAANAAVSQVGHLLCSPRHHPYFRP